MIARVGQKRQSEEALKTPKVSNDGDQKKSKNTGEYLFSSQQWQRLVPSSTECNDHHELELSGVGNHRLVQVLTDLVRSKGPTVLFLMETKLSIQELDPIKIEIGFNSTLAIPSI